jgi:hypothetical protein
MLRAIDDDVVDVVPIEYELPSGQPGASFVELEWVGQKDSLEGAAATRGMHVTSADALIVSRTVLGQNRAYLFEWKNAECYPLDKCKGLGKSGRTRRNRYEALYGADDSPFTSEVPLDELLYEPFYQLMRLGLLGAKMVRGSELSVTEARVVVVCPKGNSEYRDRVTSPGLRARSLTSVEQAMRAVARNPDMFRVIDPTLLARAIGAIGSPEISEWLGYNSHRYGWPAG